MVAFITLAPAAVFRRISPAASAASVGARARHRVDATAARVWRVLSQVLVFLWASLALAFLLSIVAGWILAGVLP